MTESPTRTKTDQIKYFAKLKGHIFLETIILTQGVNVRSPKIWGKVTKTVDNYGDSVDKGHEMTRMIHREAQGLKGKPLNSPCGI